MTDIALSTLTKMAKEQWASELLRKWESRYLTITHGLRSVFCISKFLMCYQEHELYHQQ